MEKSCRLLIVKTAWIESVELVLAATWIIGALEENFIIIDTSSGALKSNFTNSLIYFSNIHLRIVDRWSLKIENREWEECENRILKLTLGTIEFRGGCGSVKSCAGAWPNIFICVSIAARSVGLVIASRLTAPS